MRVAMYYANNDVRLQEMPVPKIGKGELLVKVIAGGICGSDVMEWYRKHKVPLVLGHEIAGEIAEVGGDVNGFKKGDRVAVSHHVPCNECFYCKQGFPTVCDTLRTTNFEPGGFSEFLRVPAINVEKGGVYKVPKDVSYDDATFIEPVACVLRGQRQARFQKGQSVLVMGCGISGMLHALVAKANGAKLVVATDLVDFRMNMAKRLGVDETIRADHDVVVKSKELNGGRGADLVVVSAGAVSAMEQALKVVDRAGAVLFFAPTHGDVSIELPVNKLFWRNATTLTTSYAASPQDHLDALDLIRTKKIDVTKLITHKFALADAVKGFQLVAKAGDSMKVIIEPQK